MTIRCWMGLIHCLTAEPDQVAEVWHASDSFGPCSLQIDYSIDGYRHISPPAVSLFYVLSDGYQNN